MTTLRIRKIESSKNLITFEEITTSTKVQLMKENMLRAMKNLYFWYKNPNSDNFSSMLYYLLCKADDINKMRFFVGFPEETICFLIWYTNKTSPQEEFFDRWLKELK